MTKSIETQVAEKDADQSLANFEQAVNQLIEKVDHTAEQIQAKVTDVVETVNLPIEIARNISAKGIDLVEIGKTQAVELRERIRGNPEPYVSWSLLVVGLLFCFRAVRSHRRIERKQISWSQLEP